MNSPITRIKFDVENEDHRKACYDLKFNRKWPMHFILEDEYDNVVQMVNDKLLQYYLKKEFSK